MLDALGPDLGAWPEDAADAAVELMACSQAAQDLFASAVVVTPTPTQGLD